MFPSNGQNATMTGSRGSPFRVLGIALVVEELGVGARLAFRYPASPPPPSPSGGSSGASDVDSPSSVPLSCRLFFALPPRSMAKLFRPKKPLCGQPVTLSVGGTVFCCRAALLGGSDRVAEGSTAAAAPSANSSGHHDGGGSSGGGGSRKGSLVLFSVIVALAPAAVGNGPSIGGLTRAPSRLAPLDSSSTSLSSTGPGPGLASSMTTATATSRSSLHSIRRVHLSLARLCRVLEREELRCSYVSVQSAMLLRIWSEAKHRAKGGGAGGRTSSSSGGGGGEAGGGSGGGGAPPGGSASVSEGVAVAGGHPPPRGRHSRVNSSSTAPLALPSSASSSLAHPERVDQDKRGGSGGGNSKGGPSSSGGGGASEAGAELEEVEMRQKFIELMLAARPPERKADDNNNDEDCVDPCPTWREHHGNLARELAQTFHALSRNDYEFLQNPTNLLSGRDGIVYINRHVAVPIEPMASGSFGGIHDSFHSISVASSSLDQHLIDGCEVAARAVRPYHTLLFPHASPAELLQATSASAINLRGGAPIPSHALQRLLLTTSPQKQLPDIAADASLPLPAVLELASHLVGTGVCVLSPTVTMSTRFACAPGSVDKMRRLALPFAHRFGPTLPIFLAVASLTTSSGGGGNGPSSATATVALGDAIAEATAGEGVAGPPLLLGSRNADAGGGGRSADLFPLPGSGSEIDGGGGGTRNTGYLDQSMPVPNRGGLSLGGSGTGLPPGVIPDSPSSEVAAASSARDTLYSMAVWLRSHLVIVEMKEFMVAVGVAPSATVVSPALDCPISHLDENTALNSTGSATNHDRFRGNEGTGTGDTLGGSNAPSLSQEQLLYRELLDAGCLEGNISTVAVCWRLGLEAWKLKRFKDWGQKEHRIEVISRIPTGEDDWGAP